MSSLNKKCCDRETAEILDFRKFSVITESLHLPLYGHNTKNDSKILLNILSKVSVSVFSFLSVWIFVPPNEWVIKYKICIFLQIIIFYCKLMPKSSHFRYYKNNVLEKKRSIATRYAMSIERFISIKLSLEFLKTTNQKLVCRRSKK